jgi:hypothetical protein
MNNNYASASEVIRNLSSMPLRFEVLITEGRFRVVRFDSPYFDGSEFWVVNEKGFLWEPADSPEAALNYLLGEEAREYNEQSLQ